MKKYLLAVVCCIMSAVAMAQVPNFGCPAGDQNLYGYSSMKYRVNAEENGMSDWTTYSTLQYGITDYLAIGADMATGGGAANLGYTVRTGVKVNQWFKIGAQFTPSFNLSDKHKFSYMTYALYMNGDITKDGKCFWVTDTWLEQDKQGLASASQWTYLGYSFTLPGNGNSITPMAGMIHSWKFDQKPDLSMGCYFTHKNISLYAWANDIVTNHPRFILAVEFKFSNK